MEPTSRLRRRCFTDYLSRHRPNTTVSIRRNQGHYTQNAKPNREGTTTSCAMAGNTRRPAQTTCCNVLPTTVSRFPHRRVQNTQGIQIHRKLPNTILPRKRTAILPNHNADVWNRLDYTRRRCHQTNGKAHTNGRRICRQTNNINTRTVIGNERHNSTRFCTRVHARINNRKLHPRRAANVRYQRTHQAPG